MTVDPHTMMQVFALVFLVLALLVWRALRRWTADARRANFDIADLWMEKGKASKQALFLIGSWAATTWGFVFVTLSYKYDAASIGGYTLFLGAYGALWITPLLARIVKGDAPPAPGAEAAKP